MSAYSDENIAKVIEKYTLVDRDEALKRVLAATDEERLEVVRISGVSIFQADDYSWYAGKDKEKSFEYFIKEQGLEDDEASIRADGFPIQLSEDELKSHTIQLEDGDFFTDEEVTLTFLEALHRLIVSGAEFPQMFASTEI